MGWPFLWPAEEPWPVCHQRNPEMVARLEAGLKRAEVMGIADREREIATLATLLIERNRNGHNAAYLPVLQLNRPEFPELPFPSDSDLFQLLWCPDVHFEGGSGYLISWRRAGAITKLRAEPPPQARDGYSIKTSTLDPERIDDYPSRYEVVPTAVASPDSEEGTAPGTKLLGFPKWIQGPDYPRCRRCEVPMDLMATVSSTEFGHDSADARSIPSEAREEYELPHGWMIGDGGDAFLFYCQNCRAEFDSRVQSS
jgi:hypothetical protein